MTFVRDYPGTRAGINSQRGDPWLGILSSMIDSGIQERKETCLRCGHIADGHLHLWPLFFSCPSRAERGLP